MYARKNFPTKKALREAVESGEKVEIYSLGIVSLGMVPAKKNGTAYLEGPHYPAPHTWHAKVEMKDGFILRVAK